MISHPRLKIRDLRVRPVNVPMRLPLQTSGATVGIDIAAYDSSGLGIIGPVRANEEAEELADGFSAIKVRPGYADAKADVEIAEEQFSRDPARLVPLKPNPQA